MPPITCHILDTCTGKPASKVSCALYFLSNLESTVDISNEAASIPFAVAETNSDGRVPNWVINKKYQDLNSVGVEQYEWTQLKPGVYKVKFRVKEYFDEQQRTTFFPFVDIHFIVRNSQEHYHIPLLLSECGYTTYRGS